MRSWTSKKRRVARKIKPRPKTCRSRAGKTGVEAEAAKTRATRPEEANKKELRWSRAECRMGMGEE